MVTSSQAIALCDISVTNRQQRREIADVPREIAGSTILCSLLLGAQTIAASGGGPHVVLACSLASFAGLVFLLRAPLPAHALLANVGEHSQDASCSRILAQIMGATLASALLAGLAQPIQLATADLAREGFAAGALTMLLVFTRHDGPHARAVVIAGFLGVATAAGVQWFGNPALLVGAAIGGMTHISDSIGPMLGVLVLGMLAALCVPDLDPESLPESLT